MNDQRALQLFDDWSELDTTQQEAQLARLRADDPALADAVAALLRADARTSGLLDHGYEALVNHEYGQEDGPATSNAASADSGQVIGAFQLLRPLGRGGMGEVWLAQRQDGDFVQTVALKLLKRGMDSEAITARFIQERRILATLNHPYIARFIDGGMSADGRLYYAMEHVAGETLTAYAQQHQLSIRKRVQLMIDICEAVAYAQSHLVVHRDLKPSNILIDTQGRPRVLDFGIAKVLEERGPDEALTHSGLRALSPAYAAPEQVLGESISTAADVFSLGVILFELLTGQRPHQRKAHSLEALLESIRSEQPQPPSHVLQRSDATTRGIQTARMQREIAGDLDTIVLTTLRREPERRYRDAAALGEDLRRWLESRPINAQPDTRSYRLRKFIARNRLIVGSASGVLLALLAGLSMATWQAKVARDQARRAQEQTERAESEAASNQRITTFALSLIRELNPHGRYDAAAKTPTQLLLESVERVRIEFKDRPIERAKLLGELGTVIGMGGDLTQAEGALQEAVDLAQYLPPDALAAIEFDLATIRMQQNRNEEAERLLKSALPKFEGASEKIKYAAMSVSYLARIARSNEHLELALERLGEAEPLFAQAWGAEHGNSIELSNNRAILLYELGRYTAAEAAYTDAITRYERSQGADYPRLIAPLSGLAKLKSVQGAHEQALALYQRALRIGQEKMGAKDAFVVRVELGLIEALCAHGDVDDAAHRLKTVDTSNLAQRPAMLASLTRVQACLAKRTGALTEQRRFLEQQMMHAEAAKPGDSITLAETRADLALNALDRNDYCEAERLHRETTALFSRLPYAQMLDRVTQTEVEAILLMRAGSEAEARRLLDTTAQQLDLALGLDSPAGKHLRARRAGLSSVRIDRANCRDAPG